MQPPATFHDLRALARAYALDCQARGLSEREATDTTGEHTDTLYRRWSTEQRLSITASALNEALKEYEAREHCEEAWNHILQSKRMLHDPTDEYQGFKGFDEITELMAFWICHELIDEQITEAYSPHDEPAAGGGHP